MLSIRTTYARNQATPVYICLSFRYLCSVSGLVVHAAGLQPVRNALSKSKPRRPPDANDADNVRGECTCTVDAIRRAAGPEQSVGRLAAASPCPSYSIVATAAATAATTTTGDISSSTLCPPFCGKCVQCRRRRRRRTRRDGGHADAGAALDLSRAIAARQRPDGLSTACGLVARVGSLGR